MDADTDALTPDGHVAGRTPSVVVDDVHLVYRVYEDRKPTLRKVVANKFRPRAHRQVHAVRGVSLAAHAGEAIGIVGRNGSGKSTLLRVVAGLLPPTSGAVYAHSTPMLLGVASALQPQLSGRRNIYLGGTALGLSRREIGAMFDDIVAFAGLRDFIDVPLQAYSSGMKARLQFAIASSVTPDILLIDEALAVGDAAFRHRSNERIRAMLQGAGTVFLVSHSAASIQQVCTRAVWLDRGQVAAEGEVEEVLSAYRAALGPEAE